MLLPARVALDVAAERAHADIAGESRESLRRDLLKGFQVHQVPRVLRGGAVLAVSVQAGRRGDIRLLERDPARDHRPADVPRNAGLVESFVEGFLVFCYFLTNWNFFSILSESSEL